MHTRIHMHMNAKARWCACTFLFIAFETHPQVINEH